MKNRKKWILISMIVTAAAVAVIWRRESSRRHLPTPAEFAWFFDNPIVNTIAGGSKNLDRIGIQPGERLLDAGSGPGRMTIPAAKRVGPEGEVVAVDIQPKMLAHLEKKIKQQGITNVTTIHGDITSGAGLASGSFDKAWMVTVLGEIPDQRNALRTVFLLLKPGGILSITEMLPDPHIQKKGKVLNLGKEAGFLTGKSWNWGWGFTQNFIKPAD
jgi:SAM-dependent methyltransferase